MTVFVFAPTRQTAEWQPAVDVYRNSSGWILKCDLAGVRLDDVHVHVGRRSVTISGVRRDWMLEEVSYCRQYSMEISYSRFQRTIELPEELSETHIRLDYRDGILLVRLMRREENDNE